jgi:hypothetical protein
LTIPQQVIREIDRTAAMVRDPEAAATLRNQVFGASLSAPAEKNMHVHKLDRAVRGSVSMSSSAASDKTCRGLNIKTAGRVIGAWRSWPHGASGPSPGAGTPPGR